MPAGDRGGAEDQAANTATQEVEAAGGPSGGADAAPPPQERAAGTAQAAPHEVRTGSHPALGAHARQVHPALPVCGAPYLLNSRGTLRTVSDCMQPPCVHAHDWLALARMLACSMVQHCHCDELPVACAGAIARQPNRG